jgi:hypothetical protein
VMLTQAESRELSELMRRLNEWRYSGGEPLTQAENQRAWDLYYRIADEMGGRNASSN